MYCSGCGSQIQSGLNFCNRCGAQIAGADPAVQKSVAENLSSALGCVGGFGLIAYIFVVFLIVRSGTDMKLLIPISVFYLGTLFGICYLILRHVADLTGKSIVRPVRSVHETNPPPFINPAATAQLGGPTFEPASVTDQTTRTLDHATLKQK